jgi:hypothetical protein
MSLDDLIPDDPTLSQDEVADTVTELTGIEPIERSNGPRFYADRDADGDGKDGTLFAAVLPGPRLYVDPTGKETVFGQTPGWIRDNDAFEQTGTYEGSFRYSIMLADSTEIPDDAKRAVEWSYGRFK